MVDFATLWVAKSTPPHVEGTLRGNHAIRGPRRAYSRREARTVNVFTVAPENQAPVVYLAWSSCWSHLTPTSGVSWCNHCSPTTVSAPRKAPTGLRSSPKHAARCPPGIRHGMDCGLRLAADAPMAGPDDERIQPASPRRGPDAFRQRGGWRGGEAGPLEGLAALVTSLGDSALPRLAHSRRGLSVGAVEARSDGSEHLRCVLADHGHDP